MLCCSPVEEKVERMVDDGIEVVLNHLEPYRLADSPLTLTLEQEMVIDTEDEGIAAVGLVDMETFDIDDEGNFYIIQWESRDDFVYKFDSRGNFLTSFVRKGQGPGEIEWGGTVMLIGENELLVKDPSKGKLSVYDKDGDLLRDMLFQDFYSPLQRLENGGYLAYKFNQFTETDYAENAVGFCNADFTEFQSFYNFKTPRITPRIKRIEITGPKRVWTATRDRFCLGRHDLGYEIWIYDMEGNVLRKIRKEYNAVSIPEAFKTNYLARIRDGNPIKEKIYFPDNWPPFQYMFMDEAGLLYVMTYEPGLNPGEYVYDIFNADGVYIARTSLANRDDRFPRKAMVKRDRIYCIRVKENGYKELVVSRMIWE
jgi:hypothetical protein